MSAAGRTRVTFQPSDVAGCIRVDLTRPSDGVAFASGEVGRRVWRACVGMTPDVVLQLVVSRDTPMYDPQVPTGVRVQVTASDAATLADWRAAIAGARS